MKRILLLLIVGIFVLPMIPTKSEIVSEKIISKDVTLYIPVAEYGDSGNCGITIEILSKENYDINKIEVTILDRGKSNEKRIINDVKMLPHFSIKGMDCTDFSGIDFGRDYAVQDGNTINIYLTKVKGEVAKVKLYTNKGIIYKEILLKYVPNVKVIKSSLPINTTCIITHPDYERIEKKNEGTKSFYFSWVFEPPYPWSWKDANPYSYIDYVNVNRYTGKFSLYCPSRYMTTIEEWCGVSDNYPWFARIPPFHCFYGWAATSVYIKGDIGGPSGYTSVSLIVRVYDLNGNYLGHYYKKVWSKGYGFYSFDKTVGGYIYILWRDTRAYRSEVLVYGYASTGSDWTQASWVNIEDGKFNYLWWFGIKG